MIKVSPVCFYAILILALFLFPAAPDAAGAVLINEVAWMGTAANSADEWVELFNSSASSVDLTGWGLYEAGGSTLILNLSGTIAANGYYLIERSDDNSVSDIAANVFGPFAGNGLNNSGEYLVLKDATGAVVDSVDASARWPAGDNTSKASMERKTDGAWQTNAGTTINGKDALGGNITGTPKAVNSQIVSASTAPSSQPSSSGGGSGSGSTTSPLLPVLKAEAGGDVVIEVAQPIAFNGLTSQGATAYKWYLGDGTVKSGAEITHTYQFPGTYLVTLEVSNSTDTNVDQLRVFVFGGKVLINEIFIGASSTAAATSNTAGGWLELYNPHQASADISGWILESGDKKFIVPNFVLIPAGGFLVLTEAVTGLNLNSQNKIGLKYPSGLVADEIVFEKPEPGFSASRTAAGFFWTKETTPGRVNIVTSTGGSLLEQVNVAPKKVVWKTESAQASNYIASFYSVVAEPSPPDQNLPVNAAIKDGFGTKMFNELSFWIMLVVALGLLAGIFYVKSAKKRIP